MLEKMPDANVQQGIFSSATQNPASWLWMALHLKKASDRICWLDEDHKSVESDRDLIFMAPTYQMLLGLSFENLLKGLLIAQGHEAEENGKLNKSFTVHNFQHLLSQLNTGELEITTEERRLLAKLERFVIWQGRYPIPKDSKDWLASAHSTAEHRDEQQLWSRMFNHLLDIGWNLNIDGKRVPLRSPAVKDDDPE